MDFVFDEAATVEAAVYLFTKLRAQRMDVMKLLKLLYLADRRAVLRWGLPITGARPWGMQHGPVLSEVYDLTKQSARSVGYRSRGQWVQFFSKIDNKTLELINPRTAPHEELSEAQIEILDEIATQFGSWTAARLSVHTHELIEYKSPTGGKKLRALNYADALRDAGKSEAEIASIMQEAGYYAAMKKDLQVR